MKHNIEGLTKVAKGIIESGKQHMPMIHLISKDNEVTICGLGFDSDKGKEKMLELFRKKIQDEKIPRYFIIMEGWVGSNAHIRPSRDFERKEALIVSEFRDTMERKIIVVPFIRENNKIKWQEEMNLDDSEQYNRWDFYREDVMDEVIEKQRKEELLKELEKTDLKELVEMAKQDYEKQTGKTPPPEFNETEAKELIIRMINDGKISKRVNEINDKC